jgi:hypothetical protein
VVLQPDDGADPRGVLCCREREEAMRRVVLFTAAAVSLGACAKAPDAIQATYVDDARFSASSCRQLAEAYTATTERLLQASNEQSSIRQKDTAGVLIAGIPLGSVMNDDLEPKVAALKGEQAAIRRSQVSHRCS